MIIGRTLCLVLLAAGTLAAQSSPMPPSRPFCDQPTQARPEDTQAAGPPVVSRGFPVGGGAFARKSVPPARPLPIDTTRLTPDQLSPHEAALIDSVVSRFPGPRGESIRRALMLRTSIGFSIGGDHPAAQAMVDEIYHLREARRDSAALAELQQQGDEAAQVYPATIVAAARLADPTAIAEVIRRTRPWHEDLLVLPNSGLTPETLAAALHALGNLRRASTEAPWVPESTFVRRPYAPADSLQRRYDQWAINGVRRAPAVEIPGFGRVPACAIEVRSRT
ncbi:MAG TPA: hypothetical protein VFT41_06720 [Gemmatimonadaceae bacterium]|nr:hypothetical protein [Gemmatimonadaceae bacterium]